MKNKEFISYANSFQAVPNLGLGRIASLLEKAQNPQNSLKYIHIAGTNGKGSVCSFLQAIFTRSGLRTGKFTSPNMLRVNERITVDGVEISDSDLERLLLAMKKLSEQVALETGEAPSQFEIWTAVAMVYFKEQNCDMVILETGLGGRFDATNVIGTPLMSIITRIDLDHTDLLGGTITEIAFEKAGIIKPNGVTLTLCQDKEALDTIAGVAEKQNNSLMTADMPVLHTPEGIYECFSYRQFDHLICGLGGLHQVENAVLAIECASHLNIPEQYIISGIRNAKNPGRFELISEEPAVIFDGAHNPNGIAALLKSLERYYQDQKKAFILAFMGDKDIGQILRLLKKVNAETFYFTKVKDNERALSADRLYDIAKENGIDGVVCNDVKSALEKCAHADTRVHKKNNGKITVICGSLYLYKDLFSSD